MRNKLYGWTIMLATVAASGCGLTEHLKDKLNGTSDNPKASASDLLALLPDYQLGVATYENCAALEGDVRARAARQAEIDRRQEELMRDINRGDRDDRTMAKSAAEPVMEDEGSMDGGDGAMQSDDEMAPQEASGDIVGNVQEGGVAEADEFSVSKQHIFLLQANAVRVVGRDSLDQIGSLPISGGNSTRLFATSERLIVISSAAGDKTTCGPDTSTPDQPTIQICRLEYRETTNVSIYDAGGKGMPKLLKQHSYEGSYLDARMIGDRLVIVGQRTLFAAQPSETEVLTVTGDAVSGVPCTAIAKSPADDMDFGLTVISTFDTANVEAPVQTNGMLGAGDRLYMTQDALYLAKAGMVWNTYFDQRVADLEDGAPLVEEWTRRQESLVITKANFDAATGAVNLAAFGKVEGRVKDQWSFKQLKDGLLAVMTSTGAIWGDEGGEGQAQNHLWVLKQDGQVLTVASGVKNFGTNEDIKAVRYVGNIAYVVTFRETDPLFAFDLTDPLAPKLMGELFMPGFSSYLHPVEGGRMLGIGTNNGLQISLYDVADPTNLQQVDVKTLSWGGSSEAQYDHHAFYYDADRLMFAIPFNDYGGGNEIFIGKPEIEGDSAMPPPPQAQSGALVYRIEGERLIEVARISHMTIGAGSCSGDVRRIMQLDDRLITVSGRGIMESNPDAPEKAGISHAFTDADNSQCNNVGWAEGDVVID